MFTPSLSANKSFVIYTLYTQKQHLHTVLSLPGRLFPLVSLSAAEGKLIELREEVMRNMLLIIILSAEDKLDPL